MYTDHLPKGEIEIFGILIQEPVTVLTNIVLFTTALFFFRKLKDESRTLSWAYFYLFMGLSSGIGVLTHSIYSYLRYYDFYEYFWIAVNVLMGVGLFFSEMATIESHIKNSTWLLRTKMMLLLKLLIGLAFLLYHKDLMVSKINIAIGFIMIILFYSFSSIKKGRAGASYIVLVMVLTILSGVFQSAGISIHPLWFNFNDIPHVVFILSFFLLYKGISLFDKS